MNEDKEASFSVFFEGFAGNQNVHSTPETCIGCGAKLNLSKLPDTDVLKKIILKTTKERPSGSSDFICESQSSQGRLTQRRSRYQSRNGAPQRTNGCYMGQPNQQNYIPMDDRINDFFNYMDQHKSGTDSATKQEKLKHFEH